MSNATCSITGCDKEAWSRGWCGTHYQRWRKNGDPNTRSAAPRKSRPARVGVEPCSIDGCDKVQRARGWCMAHWTRWRRHGDPLARRPGEVIDGKRICPGCGIDKPLTDYSPASTGRCKRCCADARARLRQTHPDRFPRVPTTRKVCECGQEFDANGIRSRYCSTECFELRRNRNNWQYVQARRARLKEVLVESFSRTEIFERDGWTCGLCGERIDPSAPHPEPGSPSIDHIVPIALGGTHERANVQASHLGCNVKKGARMSA